jgi:hypothetical protein
MNGMWVLRCDFLCCWVRYVLCFVFAQGNGNKLYS